MKAFPLIFACIGRTSIERLLDGACLPVQPQLVATDVIGLGTSTLQLDSHAAIEVGLF